MWANWHHRYTGGGERPKIDCSGDEDLARQEYAADADINNIIKRIMAGDTSMLRSTMHGLVDYTAGLTEAYEAAEELRNAYVNLPEHVRVTLTQEDFIAKLAAGESIDVSEKQETVTQVTDETPQPEA